MEPNIWKEKFNIRSYEVDSGGRLSIVSIFNLMQEAASKHADALGVSIQQLHSENFTWLLSRLKIKINAYPGWGDQLAVHTWPSGIRRLFALRDFHLIDQNDNDVAFALSAWLVLDILKKRPARISNFIERLNPLDGNHVLPDPLEKLPKVDAFTYERRFRVRFGDLDINQHVNNASYVAWMFEGVPEDVHERLWLTELEINFLAESFLQDYVVCRTQPQDSDNRIFNHALFREADGQELVRAKTVWQNIEEDLG
jgi:acyl-ACP thioesterase